MELVGAGLACFALSELWGAPVALLVAGVVLVVGAELIYDSSVLSVPLPTRPHPAASVRTRWARLVSRVRVARLMRRVRKGAGWPVEVVE